MRAETNVVYFDAKGSENTDETLRLAHRRARELGVRDVVVASYSGETGVKATRVFDSHNLVVVAGVMGVKEPNVHPMIAENRATIEASGAPLLFAGHAFGMLGRAVARRFGGIQADEVIAHALRLFGSGVKVACEITCMAVDAGLVPAGAEVIAIAGSHSGADSALVIKASNTHTFFETRVLEIICKPRL